MTPRANAGFAAAFASGEAESLGRQLLAQLPRDAAATLGILYVSEPAAHALPALVAELAAGTGIASWTGGVGLGVCGAGEEVYDRPAAAVLTAAVPEDAFRIFASTGDPAADLPRQHGKWIEATQPILALVHADPRCPDLLRATIDAGTATGAFLVGGLVSHRTRATLVARTAGSNESGTDAGGIAGLMLAPEVGVATALSQGCMPIGPVRRIDEARDNVVMAIDGRPALDVFRDDIGPELAQNLRRVGGIIFAGLPVTGSDTGDYLVRNLMAIDPGQGWIVLGAEVSPGDPIVFCRRDPESAKQDLARMVKQLAGRLSGPPKAGVYVSCVARGVSLFGEAGVEANVIRETLGEFPLVG
ncbi:MAG TPA: FIST C-terminal domain-containing protein, partial [Stellaceae bacterium]|nr:FIST C-terminal domain-containing protein [Stellaceae bacterium]